jgi:hypothetical protein
MKITIENTSKLVKLEVNGAEVPARIWQGETESGTPVQCFITRIAPEVPMDDPRNDVFARELAEQAAPRPTVQAIPLRMIL